MLRVALTGGIATGKTYVLNRLRDRGIATIDADEIVHDALGTATPTARAVAERFGTAFVKPDGSIDRALLAAKVFRDPDTRLALEAIIHPVVYEEINKWFGSLQRDVGVASIPLLFETQREGDFDYIVVTACPPAMQLERLLGRDRMNEEEARQRIAAQLPTDEKARRANFVIRTGGTKLSTDMQIDKLLAELVETRN